MKRRGDNSTLMIQLERLIAQLEEQRRDNNR
jgi:hypothetical protein